MQKVKPKTWKNISKESAEKVRKFLLSSGGREDKELKGIGESWRVRTEKSIFTYYDNGTLFCNRATI